MSVLFFALFTAASAVPLFRHQIEIGPYLLRIRFTPDPSSVPIERTLVTYRSLTDTTKPSVEDGPNLFASSGSLHELAVDPGEVYTCILSAYSATAVGNETITVTVPAIPSPPQGTMTRPALSVPPPPLSITSPVLPFLRLSNFAPRVPPSLWPVVRDSSALQLPPSVSPKAIASFQPVIPAAQVLSPWAAGVLRAVDVDTSYGVAAAVFVGTLLSSTSPTAGIATALLASAGVLGPDVVAAVPALSVFAAAGRRVGAGVDFEEGASAEVCIRAHRVASVAAAAVKGAVVAAAGFVLVSVLYKCMGWTLVDGKCGSIMRDEKVRKGEAREALESVDGRDKSLLHRQRWRVDEERLTSNMLTAGRVYCGPVVSGALTFSRTGVVVGAIGVQCWVHASDLRACQPFWGAIGSIAGLAAGVAYVGVCCGVLYMMYTAQPIPRSLRVPASPPPGLIKAKVGKVDVEVPAPSPEELRGPQRGWGGWDDDSAANVRRTTPSFGLQRPLRGLPPSPPGSVGRSNGSFSLGWSPTYPTASSVADDYTHLRGRRPSPSSRRSGRSRSPSQALSSSKSPPRGGVRKRARRSSSRSTSRSHGPGGAHRRGRPKRGVSKSRAASPSHSPKHEGKGKSKGPRRPKRLRQRSRSRSQSRGPSHQRRRTRSRSRSRSVSRSQQRGRPAKAKGEGKGVRISSTAPSRAPLKPSRGSSLSPKRRRSAIPSPRRGTRRPRSGRSLSLKSSASPPRSRSKTKGGKHSNLRSRSGSPKKRKK